MTKTTTIVGALTGLLFGFATHAGAQTAPAPLMQGWVNINGGAQPATRTFATAGTIPIYGEQATFTADHHVGNGPIFDVNGGYRIRPNIGVGAGYTTFKAKKDASAVHSSVPSPLFFNSPQVQNQTVPDLNHTENAFYVQGVFFMPLTNNFDVAVGVGPAFFKVKQDLISRIDIPAGTQAAVPVIATESKTAVGANVSVDLNYLFTPRIGAGLFVRYAGAKAGLDAAPDLKVGGFQAGLGLRVRF
jgi:hypothetical protein